MFGGSLLPQTTTLYQLSPPKPKGGLALGERQHPFPFVHLATLPSARIGETEDT